MRAVKDGGPAFPGGTTQFPAHSERHGLPTQSGMSLRDYFAAKAMDGFNRQMVAYEWGEAVVDKAAAMAYKIADAMLRAREVRS